MRIDKILKKLELEHTSKIKIPENYAQYKVDCYNNEAGKLNESDGYNCDKCKNKGLIMHLNKGIYESVSECECMTIRRTIARMKDSGIGEMLSTCTFKNYEVTDEWQQLVKDKAVDYVKNGTNNNAWWYIGGQVGAGKTHISTAICRELMKRGKRLKYMLWRDELNYLKSVAGDSSEYLNRSARLKELKTVPVLYIDDLFKTGRTNDGQRVMPTAADIATTFEIVNARYCDKELLTLFSSELTTTQLLSVDEGLASRIIERLDGGKYALNIGQDIKRNYRLRNSGETL